jgi:hypothetical protein
MSKLSHSDDKFMREELQVRFERLTVSLIGDAEEISQIDKFAKLEVGPVELASLSNAVTHIQAFILKHRRKVAA